MERKQSTWIERLAMQPLRLVLEQGLSPGRLAACVTAGVVLGTFPVPGTTTLLCAAAALLFGLNLAAIQVVNYAVYPLQILSLIPLMEAGGWLFGRHGERVSRRLVEATLHGGGIAAMHTLGWLTVQAIAAWAVLAGPAGWMLFRISRKVLHAWERRRRLLGTTNG